MADSYYHYFYIVIRHLSPVCPAHLPGFNYADAKGRKNAANTRVKTLIGEQGKQTEISREIQLLKSNLFVERVVNNLPLQVGYYKEGKTKFINTELYTTSPFDVEASTVSPDILNTPIYVKIINTNKVYLGFSMNGKEYEYTRDTSKIFTNPYFSVKIHIKESLTPDDFSGIFYFKFLDKNDMIDEVTDKIEVLPLDPSTKTIGIQYKDRNAVKAKDIVATVADQFIEYDIERKNEGFNNILALINEQIDSFGEKSDRFQDSITQEKIRDGYLNEGDDFLSDLSDKLSDYESKFRDFEYDISLMQTFKQLLLSNKEYANLPSIKFRTVPDDFGGEIEHVNDLQMQRNIDLLDATTEHPTVRLIDKQIEDQKIKLNKNLDNAIGGLQAAYSSTRQEYQKYMDEMARLPGLQSKYLRLDKMADIRNNFVMNLYEQKANYLIAKAGVVSDYVLLEKAKTDPTPVSPNENVVKISGFAVGLLIGLIMIAIRYLLHNTITTIEDVEKKTQAPLLGIIPRYKEELERSQIVVTQDPKAAITEAFRAVRTNLQFISNTPGSKVLSTTSTIPGEGKTFVSLNIAAILTLLNKKVIILDCDMRKPRLDKIFDVESHKGVSTILSGQTTVDDCIMESGIPHLDFITSGPVPPNPSELILLPKLHELLGYLKSKYEYIIIDTPPIGLVTDALEILKASDYPVYILRAAYSNRSFVHSINRIITESKIKNLSTIINDYGRGASGYGYSYGYNYRYNYGYGYGYGYGYYSAKYGEGYYTAETKRKKKSWFERVLGR